jgi:serine/threonine protein kinase/Flp pilus assembly protein TadD
MICPHGHQWQSASTEAATEAQPANVCPVCGAIGTNQETLLSDARSSLRDQLPPLPGPVALSGRAHQPLAAQERQVGNYTLLAEIGRGGMGVVYKAWQNGTNRLVALKMILAGEFAGDEEIARFRIEGEAAASLQHPNIVQIYEVGEQDGRSFFSLEFVEGSTLEKCLARSPLSARQAAQLLETVARAVQYAHERGIVHRDLKPANILLSADRIPKITDFGLAKRLQGQVGRTETGAILGTPSYMAPEQALGQSRAIGPAADVYALGAILYEMLTGRPPFKGASILDTLEQVRFQEPIPPRRLQPKVPRDLETICLKALQKEPRKRYASAEALAEDVRRFLAGKPIQARPVSVPERLWRWSRRNPVVAILLAAFILSVTGSLVGLTILWQRAEAARLRSEKNSQLAAKAIHRFYTEVGQSEELKAHDLEELRQKLLRMAKEFYEELLAEPGTEPHIQAERAQAYWRLADLTSIMESKAQAIGLHEQALAIFAELARQYPHEWQYQRDLARTHLYLGPLYADTKNTAKAEQTFERALELFGQLPADVRQTAEHQGQLAEIYNNQGQLYQLRDKVKARQAHEQAQKIRSQLVAEYPTVADYQRDLAITHTNLGAFFFYDQKLDKAEKHWQKACSLSQGLANRHKSNPVYQGDLARDLNQLSVLYVKKGELKKAEENWKLVLQIQEELVRRHPRVAEDRNYLAGTHNNLGYLCQNTRRFPEAREHYQQAVKLAEALVQGHPGDAGFAYTLAVACWNCGNLAKDTGKPEDALRWYGRAVTQLRPIVTADPNNARARALLVKVLGRQALTLARLGKYAEADREVEPLVGRKDLLPDDLLALARVYAVCAAQAAKDAQKSPIERDKLAQSYTRQALNVLVRLQKANYFTDPARRKLLKDDDFSALQGQPEFRKLLTGTSWLPSVKRRLQDPCDPWVL